MAQVQMSLDLRERSSRRKAGQKLAARMMAILAVRKTWTTWAVLARYGMKDRECRLGRECSHGRILQGQKGYKLLRYATSEEVRDAYMSFMRQIDAETKQAQLLMRRAHDSLNRRGVA
jgi:hypothetical protein